IPSSCRCGPCRGRSWPTSPRRSPTTSPRSTARCRRCWPTRGSTTPRRARAAPVARRARGSPRGGGSSRRGAGVSSPAVAPPELAVDLCRGARERAAHFAVRRAVFVEEQAMFAADDRDERDLDVVTLHALGRAGGRAAGAVRLYPIGGDEWKGDPLAGLRQARHGPPGPPPRGLPAAPAGAPP